MKAYTWGKMLVGGATMCIGGPALIYYVMPTEEELFLRYNPELQRRSLENRQGKQEDFERFVSKLKDYSKSDKPIWTEWENQAAKAREMGVQAELDRRKAEADESERRRQEMRDSVK